MARLMPPPGTVTRKQAVKVLQREGIIKSSSMLEKLKGIDRVVLEGRTHGFYHESQLLSIINSRRNAEHKSPLQSIFDEEHKIVCRQATIADMPGVYAVAEKLFGHTTSAEDRIPLIKRVPEGNLVVTDHDVVVGYIHLQPFRQEPLQRFMHGKMRGGEITVDCLDPFETGKVVNILVKSVGSYHEQIATSKLYNQVLFYGLQKEMIAWGKKGYIIDKVYATSETQSGIEAAASFRMASLGKIPGSKGKQRFAYELDIASSNLRFLRGYKQALEEWRTRHQREYERAWERYRKQQKVD